jgi:hypothetical protein
VYETLTRNAAQLGKLLPAVWSPAGRQVLKRQLGGELTIRGLVLRSRSVLRLLSA